MTPEQLREAPDVVVVDVRDEDEWAAGHIPDSTCVPVDQLDGYDPPSAASTVVLVCRSGNRSGAAMASMRDRGITTEHLDGGLRAWADADGRLVTEEGEDGVIVEAVDPSLQEQLESVMLTVALAAQERFGDREPTDAEMREFLHERLVAEGRTPEEADAFLDAL